MVETEEDEEDFLVNFSSTLNQWDLEHLFKA